MHKYCEFQADTAIAINRSINQIVHVHVQSPKPGWGNLAIDKSPRPIISGMVGDAALAYDNYGNVYLWGRKFG